MNFRKNERVPPLKNIKIFKVSNKEVQKNPEPLILYIQISIDRLNQPV